MTAHSAPVPDRSDQDPGLAKAGTAPMYGMAGTLSLRALVASRVREVFAALYPRRPADRGDAP